MQESSLKLKKYAAVGIGVVFFVMFFGVAVKASLVSIFLGYGVTENFDSFDAKQTSLYKEVMKIYKQYVQERTRELDEMSEKIRQDHQDYEYQSVYNSETGRYETEKVWFCTATIHQYFQPINSAYLFAYLSCTLSCTKTAELMNTNHPYQPGEYELYKFWDSISELKQIEVPDSEQEFNVFNDLLSIEEIAKLYFTTESEQKRFMESVYYVRQYLGTEDDYFETGVPGVIESPYRMNIPLYYQYKAPWGSKRYGNGTISKNGCAPTSIAMVFSYLLSSDIYPDTITAFTGNRYYVNGAGSSWDIFPACADQWGVTCTNVGISAQKIISELSQGHPVILSMGPGKFTSGGHLIVITGINSEGKVYVNDPNDNTSKNHIGQEFNLGQILLEAKGGWSFY